MFIFNLIEFPCIDLFINGASLRPQNNNISKMIYGGNLAMLYYTYVIFFFTWIFFCFCFCIFIIWSLLYLSLLYYQSKNYLKLLICNSSLAFTAKMGTKLGSLKCSIHSHIKLYINVIQVAVKNIYLYTRSLVFDSTLFNFTYV